MTIEIEVPPSALFKLFESDEISEGMVHEVPGGASIKLGRRTLEKRHVPGLQILVPIVVTLGSGIVINVFSNWLYDKLKGEKTRILRINRVQVEITTRDAITKVIKESIEQEEKSP
jgi:hypothetical protein